ncbi:MAG TPA: DUF177 domain-containing protein [Vicinamibacteria bacterium]|nr:DUF177 domain-containing protein [Vicinamibacteria bacterium]
MYLDLQNVPLEGQAVDRTIAATQFGVLDDAFELSSDVAIAARVFPTGEPQERAFRLKGLLTAKLEVVCVRCLDRFRIALSEPLDLMYLPSSANVAREVEEDDDEGHALGADEMTVGFYRDDRIDLTHMMLEQIVLSLPMKPLCRPECLGLCPECGTNRNEMACGCGTQSMDPRWDALKSLLGS